MWLQGQCPELPSRRGLGRGTPRWAVGNVFSQSVNPLCPRLPQALPGWGRGRGEPKSLGGASGLGPPPTSCSAPCPPQLFLCCLLNLQESGLLCEVRQGLGVGGTVPESSGGGLEQGRGQTGAGADWWSR